MLSDSTLQSKFKSFAFGNHDIVFDPIKIITILGEGGIRTLDRV